MITPVTALAGFPPPAPRLVIMVIWLSQQPFSHDHEGGDG
jgi:hypothetical protein